MSTDVARRASVPVLVRSLRTAGPSDPSVVFVHPGALSADVYGVAADAVADAVPTPVAIDVLDLQAVPEYYQQAGAGLTIETLAERLAAAAGLAQMSGPVVLVGWSFGGVLAHAMAARMPTPARRLVVLDSIAAVEGNKPEVDELEPQTLLDWCYRYLEAKRGVSFPVHLRPTSLAELLEICTAYGALPADTALAGLTKVYDTYVEGLRRNSHLTRDFVPPTVGVPITAVRAQTSLVGEAGPLGYDRLTTAGCVTVSCPGSHYSMLTRPASVAAIAQVVTDALVASRD